MAEASVVQRYVEKLVVEEVESVNLILSKDEAQTLAVVLGRIAGSVTHSPRKHTSNMLLALCRANIKWHDTEEDDLVDLSNRCILFKDYNKE